MGFGFFQRNLVFSAPCRLHLYIIYFFSLIILHFYQILDKIFHNLNVPDLKSCRLVSHAWADHGAALLGNRSYFNVNELVYYNSGSKLCLSTPLINEKLVRRLKFYDGTKLFGQEYQGVEVITNGLRMVESKEIQYVRLKLEKYQACGDSKSTSKTCGPP